MADWKVEEPTVLDIEEPVSVLRVRLVAGHVDVVTTDSPGARVEVTEIDGAALFVSIEAGQLVIAHQELRWDGILSWLRSDRRAARVSVAVPESCDVKVGVVSADAVVAGVDGRVEVRSVSGEAVLDGVTGQVDVESVSGDVEARAVSGGLNVKTVSGDLTLVSAQTERVRAKSVSGDMTLDLRAGAGIDVDLSTVSGDVTVRLPDQVGVKVDVMSMSGELSSAFEGLAVESSPGRRRLSGRIGSGAGALHGRTVSGGVALLAREPA